MLRQRKLLDIAGLVFDKLVHGGKLEKSEAHVSFEYNYGFSFFKFTLRIDGIYYIAHVHYNGCVHMYSTGQDSPFSLHDGAGKIIFSPQKTCQMFLFFFNFQVMTLVNILQ